MIKQKRVNLDERAKSIDVDMLDLWLLAQREQPDVPDIIISSQAFMFFIAGFDTLAYTPYLLIYLLAVNPSCQDRALEQIEEVCGNSDISYDMLVKLTYLEACILETLRLHPADYMLDRVCMEDITIAGIAVEKDCAVQIPIPVIHRDPRYFPDPEKFIPERFLKDHGSDSNTQAFLGFGQGPRSCTGRRLATLSIMMTMAHILRIFKITACNGTPSVLKFKPGQFFMPMTEKPISVNLSRR